MAISRLVSGAVDSLQPEDVSIVDADSARSLGLGHGGQQDGEGLEASLAQRLITTLEPVVGLDRIRASVHVDQDQSTVEENQEKYDPTVSALLSDQKSQDQSAGGATQAGVPGTTSNIPTGKPKTPSTPDNSQTSMTESAQYGVNRVMTRTVTPAGRIQRITAAILVDDATIKSMQGSKVTYTKHKRSAEELNKIQQIAQAVIGFDAKRGDTISVEEMPFDGNASDADLVTPNWIQKEGKTLSNYSSLLRPASLLALFLLVYMFMVRPLQKQVLAPGRAAAQPPPALPASPGFEQLPLRQPEPQLGNQRAAQLKEQTIEMIRQKPINTTRAVQAWLHEETS
jgi:flagellar M-ring protein FliF